MMRSRILHGGLLGDTSSGMKYLGEVRDGVPATNTGIVSGGASVFDGIFLTAIRAPLVA